MGRRWGDGFGWVEEEGREREGRVKRKIDRKSKGDGMRKGGGGRWGERGRNREREGGGWKMGRKTRTT